MVWELASLDDGTGSALYAGGAFTVVGNAKTVGAGRWRDLTWSSLGEFTPTQPVGRFAVFDSGSGPEIYAAGAFTAPLARWNGSDWSPLPDLPDGPVRALHVFDDGSGSALYATGSFSSIGPLVANGIAKWNGSTWSALGTGLSGEGNSLTSFDDGTGPALYVGGSFDAAGGVVASNIAKWKNGAWSALGTGVTSGIIGVAALVGGSVGGGAPRLYAAGLFTSAGGTAVGHIASWDGANWSSLGSGVSGFTPWNAFTGPHVNTLAIFDDGAGAQLYVGGEFTSALPGAPNAPCLARWDGSSWSAVPGFDPQVFRMVSALAVHDDGTGPALFVGGWFDVAGGARMNNIAKWTGTGWHPLGRGAGFDDRVTAFTTFDDGQGNAIYAGGAFTNADGRDLRRIARFDGSSWSPLGEGFSNGTVLELTSYDDGSGPNLIAGGSFYDPTSTTALNYIARWDGASWSPLGLGVDYSVNALAVFDDGGGAALYAGGSFQTAGSGTARRLAKWDSTDWSEVGGGIVAGAPTPLVHALAVFDDGTGPALYVGGQFSMVGTTRASNVARWDGSAWSTLGSGTNGPVYALTVFDDGRGRALYAGGGYSNAGGVSASSVARWDGTSWSSVAVGFQNPDSWVSALTAFDDGSGVGPALVAGGKFRVEDGENLARLVGTRWKPLGGVVDDWVYALAAFDDETALGPQLFVGGRFQATEEIASCNIARLACAGATVSYCFGDTFHCPCANAESSAESQGCLNSQLVGGRLDGAGHVSLSDDSLILSASGMTDATALFVQGTTTVAMGAGRALGDGLTCTGGALVRLKTQTIASGGASYPGAGDSAVSTSGLVQAPGTRTYQVMYRDVAAYCTPDTFNFTNAVQVGWLP